MDAPIVGRDGTVNVVSAMRHYGSWQRNHFRASRFYASGPEVGQMVRAIIAARKTI